MTFLDLCGCATLLSSQALSKVDTLFDVLDKYCSLLSVPRAIAQLYSSVRFLDHSISNLGGGGGVDWRGQGVG
jgi:hypothetical protein